MKKITALILSLIMIMSFTACENNDKNTGFTFTDDINQTVTIKKHDNVASLLGSYADMWILAGGKICASADDAWEDFNLDLPETTINLGTAHRPNKEKLFASEPDFVLASSKLSKHVELKETLNSANIPVAYFDVNGFNSYLKVFKIMTDITGKKENYKKYGLNQKNKIDEIIERNKDKKVQTALVMRASAQSIRAKNSKSTMLGGMLKDFNVENIADSDSMLLENLNVESILIKNPDKIFLVETGDNVKGIKPNVEKMFAENPLWQQLSAVKNNRVYYMDKHLYNLKPNAHFVEAYENLEKILYEE